MIPVKHDLTGGETVVVQGASLPSDGEPVELIHPVSDPENLFNVPV